MILYRTLVGGDIPAGLSLCRSAGWNQTVEDWELFLKLSPKGCCAAVDDEGQVRGTVATVRYEDRFSWIGMVLVDPTCQRRGIGIQLLRESLHILRDEDTVKLDATPAGRHIYTQLDFVDEYPLSRMVADTLDHQKLGVTASRKMLESDVPAVLRMDRETFGARRETVLRSLLRRNPQYCWILEGAAGIRGYCLGRSGHQFAHIGPVIATDAEAAKDLVTSALRHVGSRPIVVDAPCHSEEWLQWLLSLGFKEQRPFVRMYRGSNAFPGVPEKQFAILGPEFG